jgi:hypothetical protein
MHRERETEQRLAKAPTDVCVDAVPRCVSVDQRVVGDLRQKPVRHQLPRQPPELRGKLRGGRLHHIYGQHAG